MPALAAVSLATGRNMSRRIDESMSIVNCWPAGPVQCNSDALADPFVAGVIFRDMS